jgi:hypothetical protein
MPRTQSVCKNHLLTNHILSFSSYQIGGKTQSDLRELKSSR